MKAHGDDDRVIVIGAGPAGIGAGIALGDRGTVLDGASDLGGLCRTLEIDGALFDLGGHSFHTPHPRIRDLVFGSLEMFEQRREARCYSHGVMIDYPFQKHFDQLTDPVVVEECAMGLQAAKRDGAAENFGELIEDRFGPGIAKHFLRPYNQKLWKVDLTALAVDWVSERVASPADVEEISNPGGGTRTPLQADTSVAYPANGGYGDIYRALARRLPDLRLGCRVTAIDPVERRLTIEGGASLRWSHLVSTMPIGRLLGLLPDVPAALSTRVGCLGVLSLALVFVVVDHPVDTSVQRVYCADPAHRAHKIVINHNSSPSLRARPRHGILAEISYSRASPLPAEDQAESTIAGLAAMGLIRSGEEVYSVTTAKVQYAYPIPTRGDDAIVRQAKDWLEERGIWTVGRFGEWAYVNSDEALHRGLELGAALAETI